MQFIGRGHRCTRIDSGKYGKYMQYMTGCSHPNCVQGTGGHWSKCSDVPQMASVMSVFGEDLLKTQPFMTLLSPLSACIYV